MNQTVYFKFESLGNIVRMLVTIMLEESSNDREIAVFHQRFDQENDIYFRNILTKLYPDGTDIGECEIRKMVMYVENSMKTDKRCKELYAKYDKAHLKSYVYFKVDNEVHYAEFGSHTRIVTELCCNFFKNFDDIDADYLKRFILENFEIKSECTTLTQISNDANRIARLIMSYNR